MGQTWRTPDIIDLEFFINQHAALPGAGPDSSAPSFNRRIYLEYCKTHPGPIHRGELLKYWLDRQRAAAQQTKNAPSPTPGAMWEESYRIICVIGIILSFLLGAAGVLSLFSYRGDTPINVFSFIWTMVVPQIFLMLLLILSLGLKRLGVWRPIHGLYPLASHIIRRMGSKLIQSTIHSLPVFQQKRLEEAYGSLTKVKILYGSVYFWPIFNLFQIIAICFNIGVLSAMLIKVSVTDLAFGWQSTLNVSSKTLHRILETISMPWSWLTPGDLAHPSLAQIEGSKIILKDQMSHLATENLVSWWPFLCFVIFFYGLLPRLMLLIYGIWRQHQILSRLTFTHAGCDRLIQHMQTPQMEIFSRPFPGIRTPSDEATRPTRSDPADLSKFTESLPAAILLIPEEVGDLFTDEIVSDRISSRFRLRTLGKIMYTVNIIQDRINLQNLLNQTDIPPESLRLVILQEAWQPPIQEILSWFRDLRKTVGEKIGMIVALIGKPDRNYKFFSPKDADLLIWEQAVNSLGDPYIRVENFGGS